MKPTDTSQPDYFHRVVDCQWACPAHTDVPEYIRLIAQGRFTDAYLLNRESNIFPGILGRVCDRPCEPACRRGRVDAKPVAICRLKHSTSPVSIGWWNRSWVSEPASRMALSRARRRFTDTLHCNAFCSISFRTLNISCFRLNSLA